MKKYVLIVMCLCLSMVVLVGCSKESPKETISNSNGGEHAIDVDNKTAEYENVIVEKTGDSDGDEADFTGTNAAVYAQNGGSLTIKNSEINTVGKHANAVFAYGEKSVIDIADSTITTTENNSGGIMVTGGGSITAANLTIETKGGSSAAIRSDRGGGTINVTGGKYSSYGSGSPAIYSTADITVNDATLYSDISEAVVIEGKNSVTLNNVTAMYAAGIPALRIISLSFIFSGITMTLCSVFQGMGNGMYSAVPAITRQILFLLPTAYVLARLGFAAGTDTVVWYSFLIAEFLSMLLALFMCKKEYRRISSEISEEEESGK